MQTKRSVLDKSPMPVNEIANIREVFENKPQSTSVDYDWFFLRGIAIENGSLSVIYLVSFFVYLSVWQFLCAWCLEKFAAMNNNKYDL